MFNLFAPKNKVLAHNIKEVPLESFEIIGIGQINPYYPERYENEKFITVLDFLNDSKDCDERESLVLTSYFALKRCPKCKQIELVPIKIRLNLNSTYKKYEEEVAYDAYSERPSRVNIPSVVNAYCNSCSSCFEIRIKSNDTWVKQAKKASKSALITPWEEYSLDLD